MLSAESITRLIDQGMLGWNGKLRGDGLLLSLGSSLQPFATPAVPVVDLADQSAIDSMYGKPITGWSTYDLTPGEVLLGPVDEPLRLGTRLVGMIGGLSHLARVGLAVHVTSPFVLPGWNGHLTLEMVNTGPCTLRLHHGMPLARLLLLSLDGPCTKTSAAHPFYGGETDLRSRYSDEFPVGPAGR